MKKLIILITVLLLSFSIYANTATYAYTSLSSEKYRADYIGSLYNFSKAETTYKSQKCISWEFGYKEKIVGKLMGGLSYGFSFVFFENDILIQFPVMLDCYYQFDWYYCSASVGTIITINDVEGSITTIPNIEVGVGIDIPLCYYLSIGVKASASLALWCLPTNISDMAMITKTKPIEVMFMIRDY